jgi:hypothetical protein
MQHGIINQMKEKEIISAEKKINYKEIFMILGFSYHNLKINFDKYIKS